MRLSRESRNWIWRLLPTCSINTQPLKSLKKILAFKKQERRKVNIRLLTNFLSSFFKTPSEILDFTIYCYFILSVPKLDELPWCQTICQLPLWWSLQWVGHFPTLWLHPTRNRRLEEKSNSVSCKNLLNQEQIESEWLR